jgi:hypothetical protein
MIHPTLLQQQSRIALATINRCRQVDAPLYPRHVLAISLQPNVPLQLEMINHCHQYFSQPYLPNAQRPLDQLEIEMMDHYSLWLARLPNLRQLRVLLRLEMINRCRLFHAQLRVQLRLVMINRYHLFHLPMRHFWFQVQQRLVPLLLVMINR